MNITISNDDTLPLHTSTHLEPKQTRPIFLHKTIWRTELYYTDSAYQMIENLQQLLQLIQLAALKKVFSFPNKNFNTFAIVKNSPPKPRLTIGWLHMLATMQFIASRGKNIAKEIKRKKKKKNIPAHQDTCRRSSSCDLVPLNWKASPHPLL